MVSGVPRESVAETEYAAYKCPSSALECDWCYRSGLASEGYCVWRSRHL